MSVVPYGRRSFQPLREGGSVHCFHVTPQGPGWVWGGPPAGWACVSAPAARATSRRTPVLTTAKPAQEEPSRVSLRKHRISPSLETPGKCGRTEITTAPPYPPPPGLPASCLWKAADLFRLSEFLTPQGYCMRRVYCAADWIYQ